MSFYNFGGRPTYGNLAFNPFTNPMWSNLSPVQEEYYRTTPAAVMGAWSNALRQYNGGSRWQQFADQWARDLYGEYQGVAGFNPEQSFAQYLSSQAQRLPGEYKQAQGTRPITRPTRYLRRY